MKIMGGLGNQMFQYAAGRALSVRLNDILKLDNSWFSISGSDTSRPSLLHYFPISILEANQEEIHNIIYQKQNIFQKILNKKGKHTSYYKSEPSYDFWQDFNTFTSPIYLNGYWQNEKYFLNIESIIRKDFEFPSFSNIEAENISKNILNSLNSVSIHIRRGDYINNPSANQFHGTCPIDYYKKALQILYEKYNSLELYFFSDDPQWVRQNFDTNGCKSNFINITEHNNAPYHDMHLMSLCKHHIIANSSFSWWSAWLSNKNGIIIAPSQWFANEKMKEFNPSLSSWIKI